MTGFRRATTARLLLVTAAACLLGAVVVHLSAVIALLVPATLGVLLLLAVVRALTTWADDATRRRIVWWTMVAFAAHLLFGLASTNLSTAIRYYLATDSFIYDDTARAIVQHWTHDLPFPGVPHGKEGFYYMLAVLYWIFGSHTAAGLAVNAALAAGLVPVVTDVTHRLFGPAAARYAGPLVVVLPGLFLWTSQLMRESGMLLLLAVALNCGTRLTERLSFSALTVLTATLLVAFTFRAPVALIVAAGLVAGVAFGREQIISGVGTGLSVLAIVVTIMVASGLGYSGYRAAVDVDLERANAVRREQVHVAGTAFAEEVDISTTRGAIQYLPLGVTAFLLGPFPWQIDNARQLPFVPDMLVWWGLLPSLWLGMRTAHRVIGRRQLIMLVPAAGVVLFMSLALGNFGTVVRERLQVVVLLVPLIALGLAQRAADRKTTGEVPVVEPVGKQLVASV